MKNENILNNESVSKCVFSTTLSNKGISVALLFLRCFVSIMMLTHAFAKITNFGTLIDSFPTPFGLNRTLALVLIICIELGGSIFLMIGLLSRLAALALVGGMTTAAFLTFHPFSIAQSELAIIYWGIYITLLISGPGKYSIDKLIQKAFFNKTDKEEE